MKRDDLTGRVFGRWTVLAFAERTERGALRWSCQCECGTIKNVYGAILRRGQTKSCGCYLKEQMSKRQRTHGMTNTPTYKVWGAMIDRTTNKNSSSWEHYGGRGIVVCGHWLKFENFLADMGERPKGTSIDRIDNMRGYEPGNCRWATIKEQNNNKRIHRKIIWREQEKTVGEWASELGFEYSTLLRRLDSGWSIDEAFLKEPFVARQLTEADKRDICSLFINGKSVAEIKKQYDSSDVRIYQILKEGDVKTSPEPISQKTKEYVCQRYSSGKTAKSIAQSLNLHRGAIRRILDEEGFPLRFPKLSQEQRVAICNRYRLGEKPTDIAAVFNIRFQTVYSIIRRYNIEGDRP